MTAVHIFKQLTNYMMLPNRRYQYLERAIEEQECRHCPDIGPPPERRHSSGAPGRPNNDNEAGILFTAES
jgi:hypothetical protein